MGLAGKMDLETELQLAALINEEASRLRAEAEREGVSAYLAKPKIRGRANPQFLQATVRSIQQSNKIVEVNEMWRRRNVELEIERGRKSRKRHHSRGESSDDNRNFTVESRPRDFCDQEDLKDEGLKDEELEQFLHSRIKRGRGAVGSRMDETGPYLPSQNEMQLGRSLAPDERAKCEWEDRIVGPMSEDKMKDWDRVTWKKRQKSSKAEFMEYEELSRESKGLSKRSKDRKERKRREGSHSKKSTRQSEKSSTRRK